jgi:hypothetical protein
MSASTWKRIRSLFPTQFRLKSHLNLFYIQITSRKATEMVTQMKKVGKDVIDFVTGAYQHFGRWRKKLNQTIFIISFSY